MQKQAKEMVISRSLITNEGLFVTTKSSEVNRTMSFGNMNVYSIKAYGVRGAGMAVVAAVSESEAKELAALEETSIWCVDYISPYSVDLLPLIYEGPPQVLSHFESGE